MDARDGLHPALGVDLPRVQAGMGTPAGAALVDLALAERPPVVTLSFGEPLRHLPGFRESAGLVPRVVPAAEIVREVAREGEERLRSLATRLRS